MPSGGKPTATSTYRCIYRQPRVAFGETPQKGQTQTEITGGEVDKANHSIQGATASLTTTVTSAEAATTSTNATDAKARTQRPSAPLRIRTKERKPDVSEKTPIKIDALQAYLEGYDSVKTQYLLDGFSQGFMLQSQGLQSANTDVKNPSIPNQLVAEVQKKLQKEIDAGRIIGPFSSPPLPNFRVSPIKVAEKKEPGKYRFIHNLSYPYDEESVNASIPRDKVAVQYSTIDDAIAYIKVVGRGAFLAKTDIKSAFRIIPVHPSQYHLLGMQWEGKYFYDTTLPMGCSISCAIFEAFSSAIEWIAKNKLDIPYMTHVLDDFLIVAPSYKESDNQLKRFLSFCDECGIPMAPEKTEGPETSLAFLGITLDVPHFLAKLPDDKLRTCHGLIQRAVAQRNITQKGLQSILGHLNFACRVVVPGRAFLRRIYALTHKALRPYHHIKMTKAAKADLNLWSTFLKDYNGRTFFRLDAVHTDEALQLYTDSSGSIGYGAVLDNHWLHGTWPAEWEGYDITFLELYPIVLSAHLWGTLLSNRTIEFHTDNMALVSIINNTSSKKPHIMALVRSLVSSMLKFNFVFYAIHIPGVLNVRADALSRQQIGRFWKEHPSANIRPTTIPPHLRPGNSWLK